MLRSTLSRTGSQPRRQAWPLAARWLVPAGLWLASPAGLFAEGTGAAAALAQSQPSASSVVNFSDKYPPGSRFMGIRLRGAIELHRLTYRGLAMGGLSGLGWDEDDQRLYALSDRSRLFHLAPKFDSRGLLVGAEVVSAFALRGRNAKPLRFADGDSEGLTVLGGRDGVAGNARLAVTLERRPRLALFSPQGRWLSELTLPEALRSAQRYRSPNEALETITVHPTLGLLTGPERPLAGEPEALVPLFRLAGQVFELPLHRAPQSALVALEALPDGSLLSMERSFQPLALSLVIALRRSAPLTEQSIGRRLHPALVAEFRSNGDWTLDNFEGLTRHRGHAFFMVSDDNESFLQQTLLVYFELIDE